MNDPLLDAARHLGITTHLCAGPDPGRLGQPIWASWPRDRLELAHEILAQVMRFDREVRIEPCAPGKLWRAMAADWSCEDTFIDAVGALALHVTLTRPRDYRATHH